MVLLSVKGAELLWGITGPSEDYDPRTQSFSAVCPIVLSGNSSDCQWRKNLLR
ncbi:hypothetical protein [Synechocystis sp. PCC 6714]|uniref:hypothetical protein n=1 Tax=Synechocystis sp. (strain PCC 6714) TaxID=1147 RepID=UPI00130EF7F3|nr:hypothetical protein [Synechocystis sp. PCC 6714]